MDPARRSTERVDAIEVLRGFGSPGARERLAVMLEEGVEDPRVRIELLQAARVVPEDMGVPILMAAAAGDESYACRARALDLLAAMKIAEAADLALELVDYPSQHDQVREAALDLLASVDDRRGLDAAFRYAELGHHDRSRPRAVVAIGRLAQHGRERAVNTLLALLEDPEWRTMVAAGEALAALRETQALPAMRQIQSNHRSERLRRLAGEWIETIERTPESGS